MKTMMNKAFRNVLLGLACGSAVLLRPHTGTAADDMCKAPHALDKYKLLRRLSLDLRNRLPSFEEYEALAGVETVPSEVIESYLASDEYRGAMRRHHENQLWPNIAQVRLSGVATQLVAVPKSQGFVDEVLRTPGRNNALRGSRDTECGDFEQTAFDPRYPMEYRPIQRIVAGERIEGYREVKPYWAPATTVKVCASEAQETETVTVGGNTIRCGTNEAQGQAACGCGKGLRYCYTGATALDVRESLREQLGRAADQASTGKVPYTDLLLAKGAEEDGRIAFYRKHLAANATLALTYNVTAADEPTSDRRFTDQTWQPTARNARHSGILTMPAFLLRFQTDRARANRFRVAFMGQYFVPAEKLEPQPGCSSDSPDLTKRCNCQYCHQALEPMAAHFGNFVEAGSALISDRKIFPVVREDCKGATNALCRRFYVTQADLPGAGRLLAHQFDADHPEYAENIDAGPRKLAESIIGDGTFARTIARTLLERLLKRTMKVEGQDASDRDTVERLATAFKESAYHYPSLVRAVVALPEYRSVR